MAKKKKKTEWDKIRDWSMEPVANCDHLEKGEVPLSQHAQIIKGIIKR